MAAPDRRTIYLSHADADKEWADRLRAHLKPLAGSTELELWHAMPMSPGDIGEVEMERAIARAAVAVLLVSEHFLRSTFIQEMELPLLSSGLRTPRYIVPILVGPCAWQDQPALPVLGMLPRDHRPLSEHQDAEDLLQEAAEVILKLLGLRATLPADSSSQFLTEAPSPFPSLDDFSPNALSALLRANGFRLSTRQSKIHMEHLLVGLYDADQSYARQRFEQAGIDRKRLAEILKEVGRVVVPVRSPYKEAKPPSGELPPVSAHVEDALREAYRKAHAVDYSEQTIFSETLLAGALSVTTCHVIQGLVASPDGGALAAAMVQLYAQGGSSADAGGAAPDPDVDEAFIRKGSAGDQPTPDDSLGFQPYVEAIAEFLLSEDTRPPLTFSIEGEWGSGKSSFMLQLEKALRARAPELRRERFREGWKGLADWLRDLPSLARSLAGPADQPEPPAKPAAWHRRLRNALRPLVAGHFRRAVRYQPCLTLRFNSWRHDKEDALWAAFALHFLDEIARQRRLPRRWLGHALLFKTRFRWQDGTFEVVRVVSVWALLACAALAIPLGFQVARPGDIKRLAASLVEVGLKAPSPPPAPGAGAAAPAAPPAPDPTLPQALLTLLLGLGATGAYLAAVSTVVLKAKELVGNPLKTNLKQYLRSPDYEGRIAFVERFHEDFPDIVAAYAGKRKVFVFIDDLDRCDIPKAAELMQAINLLIADDPRLIFIIGMDREKVAAGLAVKYEKLLPYLALSERAETRPAPATATPGGQPSRAVAAPAAGDDAGRWFGVEYGYAFIEKFIQVPFLVPAPTEPDIRRFLAKIASDATLSEPATRSLGEGDAKRRRPVELAGSTSRSAGQEGTGGPGAPSAAAPDGTLVAATGGGTAAAAAAASTADIAKRRERLRIEFREDSEAIQAVALVLAPALEYNPRRIKQFLNLFRLRAYIANETGLFDEVSDLPQMTLELLGKFVALGLAWPRLLAEAADDRELLGRLERAAVGSLSWDELSLREARWLERPRLRALLKHGLEVSGADAPVPLGFSQIDVGHLFRVSPRIERTPRRRRPPLRAETGGQENLVSLPA